MALGSDVKRQTKPEELEELLESLEKLIERTKVLYEQYFMGIQKIAPMQMHRDVERKVRELTQQQLRNTGLRFRFATLSQKFGSYNTYWKRTLREIEQGKYVRDLARVQRKADQMGEELPEELLVKLPRLVQDRIRRDRARLAERARREAGEKPAGEKPRDAAAFGAMPQSAEPPTAPHQISEAEARALFAEGDLDLDLDGLFTAMTVPGFTVEDELDSLELTETPAPPRPARGASAAPPVAPAAQPAPPSIPPAVPRATIPPAVPPARPSKTTRLSVPIPIIGAKPGAPGEAKPSAGQDDSFRVPAPPGPAKSSGPPSIPPPGGPPRATLPPPAKTIPPPPARRRTEPPAAAAPPPGMDDKQCRELYTSYLKARQLVGEKNDDVTYEKLVSSLGKQAAAIMTQHGARGVEFHVVVRGDKVVLKAKPIKPDK